MAMVVVVRRRRRRTTRMMCAYRKASRLVTRHSSK
jgi:hypothetical protein